MAEIIKVEDWYEINVSNSVGRGGTNINTDVLVVQALLKYGLEGRHYFRGIRIAEPTGAIDSNTLQLIKQYQRYMRKVCGKKVSIDGRIDPARNGLNVPGKNLLWTISSLNSEINEMHLLNSRPGSPIQDLCNRYPQVKAVLGKMPVGTLDLALESSVRRIGTLNLGLE